MIAMVAPEKYPRSTPQRNGRTIDGVPFGRDKHEKNGKGGADYPLSYSSFFFYLRKGGALKRSEDSNFF